MAQNSLGGTNKYNTRWTKTDPMINAKSVASGSIDTTITWKAPDEHAFTSTTVIGAGPNRIGRDYFFNGWEPKDGKWVPRPLSENGWQFKDGKWQERPPMVPPNDD